MIIMMIIAYYFIHSFIFGFRLSPEYTFYCILFFVVCNLISNKTIALHKLITIPFYIIQDYDCIWYIDT